MKYTGRCRVRPKLSREVHRATHAGSLPWSGKSATRAAPASGTSRIKVRIESFIAILSAPRHADVSSKKVSQDRAPRNQHEKKQSDCTHGKPGSVGAQIARLPALQDCSGERGDAAEQPCDAAEYCDVDHPLEEEF